MISELSYVDVEPLAPPFSGEIITLGFTGTDQLLAVSAADYRRIVDMVGSQDLTERTIQLAPCADGRIRVTFLAS